VHRVQGASRSENFQAFTNLIFAAPPIVGSGIVVAMNMTLFDTNDVTTSCADSGGHEYVRVVSRWHQTGRVKSEIWYLPRVQRTSASYTVVAGASGGRMAASAVEVGDLGYAGLLSGVFTGAIGNSNVIDTGATIPLTALESFVLAATIIGVNSTSSLVIRADTPAWYEEGEHRSLFFFPSEEDSRKVVKPTLADGDPQQAIWDFPTAGPWATVLATFSTDARPQPVIRNLTGSVRQFGGAILCFQGPPNKSVDWRILEGHGTLTPFTTFTDALGRCSCRYEAAGFVEHVVVGVAYVPED